MLSCGTRKAEGMLRHANSFADDARGATTVEYAIIAGVMCMCIVASMVGVTNPVTTIFEVIAGLFPAI